MVSPFCYLAHLRLPELAERYGCPVVYHPMDLPTAKIAAGNYGPSNREVPAKMKVLFADLQRWARRYQAPFRFPQKFDCGRWNIASIYAREHGQAQRFVSEGYARIFGRGIDPTDERELREAAVSVGLDGDALLDYSASSKGKTDFRRECIEAHGRGVFGAPMFFVEDQIFWGNDRLDFLEEYLASLPVETA
jgi:2-hydroxychromene-2-carboxylate isomerase